MEDFIAWKPPQDAYAGVFKPVDRSRVPRWRMKTRYLLAQRTNAFMPSWLKDSQTMKKIFKGIRPKKSRSKKDKRKKIITAPLPETQVWEQVGTRPGTKFSRLIAGSALDLGTAGK